MELPGEAAGDPAVVEAGVAARAVEVVVRVWAVGEGDGERDVYRHGWMDREGGDKTGGGGDGIGCDAMRWLGVRM